jgi:hypothetical protein
MNREQRMNSDEMAAVVSRLDAILCELAVISAGLCGGKGAYEARQQFRRQMEHPSLEQPVVKGLAS